MHRTSLHRKVTVLDVETKFQGGGSIRTANENKDYFVESLGVKFTLPSEYILAAKINHDNSDFIYQLVKYVFPSKEFVLSTQLVNAEKIQHSFFKDEYAKYVNSLVLRKIKLEGNLIRQVSEHVFNDVYKESKQ